MVVHIISETLIVAELTAAETGADADVLAKHIYEALDEFGLERWHSVELELFQRGESALAFAVPVKVLLPECLLRLAAAGGAGEFL